MEQLPFCVASHDLKRHLNDIDKQVVMENLLSFWSLEEASNIDSDYLFEALLETKGLWHDFIQSDDNCIEAKAKAFQKAFIEAVATMLKNKVESI